LLLVDVFGVSPFFVFVGSQENNMLMNIDLEMMNEHKQLQAEPELEP
jgi:hypothetical protein